MTEYIDQLKCGGFKVRRRTAVAAFAVVSSVSIPAIQQPAEARTANYGCNDGDQPGADIYLNPNFSFENLSDFWHYYVEHYNGSYHATSKFTFDFLFGGVPAQANSYFYTSHNEDGKADGLAYPATKSYTTNFTGSPQYYHYKRSCTY